MGLTDSELGRAKELMLDGLILHHGEVTALFNHIAQQDGEIARLVAIVKAATAWREAKNVSYVESCSTDGVTPKLIALWNKEREAEDGFWAALDAAGEVWRDV